MSTRPAVSVIVPFAGGAEDARRLTAVLGALETRDGDELIVADNTPEGIVGAIAEDGPIRVVRATKERSSYHARNVAAAAASGEWLLFTDADCTPPADLIDRYFEPPPSGRCGAMAGEILGDPDDPTLAGRWARSRGRLEQWRSLGHPYLPYASTANLCVLRAAFEDLTGFVEGVRSGGDTDFCWRLQQAGYTIEYRPGAAITHRHRATVPLMLRQSVVYGGSRAWLERRHPDGPPSARVAMGLRFSLAAVRALARGRADESRYYALDLADVAAQAFGARRANRPPPVVPEIPASRAVVLFGEFPPERWSRHWLGEDRPRPGSMIEALRRPRFPRAESIVDLRVSFAEDDPLPVRVAASLVLLVSRPGASLRFLLSRGLRRMLLCAPAARRIAGSCETVRAGERAALSYASDVARLAGCLDVSVADGTISREGPDGPGR